MDKQTLVRILFSLNYNDICSEKLFKALEDLDYKSYIPYFDSLPVEIIQKIMISLTLREIYYFSQTCKRIYSLSKDVHLWAKKAEFDFGYSFNLFICPKYVNYDYHMHKYRIIKFVRQNHKQFIMDETDSQCFKPSVQFYNEVKLFYFEPTPYILGYACSLNLITIVRMILNDGRVKATDNHNTAIFNACRNGSYETAYYLLKNYPEVDPTNINPDLVDRKYYTLYQACENGHTKIVKLLLKDPRIVVNCNLFNPLVTAVLTGNIEIVKILLSDKRVNPAHNDNMAVMLACRKGNIDIYKLLISFPEVDPSARENICIIDACRNGYTEIVKRLLSDKRVTPTQYCLELSVKGNYLEIVRELLKDGRVDPSYNNNEYVKLALSKGYLDMIKLLYTDRRVSLEKFIDPTDYEGIDMNIW